MHLIFCLWNEIMSLKEAAQASAYASSFKVIEPMNIVSTLRRPSTYTIELGQSTSIETEKHQLHTIGMQGMKTGKCRTDVHKQNDHY